MINFIEGKITLATQTINATSDYKDLIDCTEKGLIEKRKDPGKGPDYFYVETVASGLRFGAIISLREKNIDYILFRWLDSPMKDWDDVSEKALRDEYRLLLNFVEKTVGGPPDNRKNRQCTWRFKWGKVEVSYEPRSFDAAIFMKPR